MTRASFWPFRNSLSKTFEMKCADVQISGATSRAYSPLLQVDITEKVCGLGRTVQEAERNMRKEIDEACNALRDIVIGLKCGEK